MYNKVTTDKQEIEPMELYPSLDEACV